MCTPGCPRGDPESACPEQSSRFHLPCKRQLSTPASPPRAGAGEPRCAPSSPCYSPPTSTNMSKPVHATCKWYPESVPPPSFLLLTPHRRLPSRRNLAWRELLVVSSYLCYRNDVSPLTTFSIINDQGFHVHSKWEGVSQLSPESLRDSPVTSLPKPMPLTTRFSDSVKNLEQHSHVFSIHFCTRHSINISWLILTIILPRI